MNIKNLAKITVAVVAIVVFTLTFKLISHFELNKKNVSLGVAQASVTVQPAPADTTPVPDIAAPSKTTTTQAS